MSKLTKGSIHTLKSKEKTPMSKKHKLFVCVIASVAVVCAACTQTKMISPSMSAPISGVGPDRLERFSDPFDVFHPDLWEMSAGYVDEKQIDSFVHADTGIEKGRYYIAPTPGAFSKSSLRSIFHLRGDFDFSAACQADFDTATPGMTRQVIIGLFDDSANAAVATFVKPGDGSSLFLNLYYGNIKTEKWQWQKTKLPGGFKGNVRFVRKGDQVEGLYLQSTDSQWQSIKVFTFNRNDVRVGFSAQNFLRRKSTSKAPAPYTFKAYFDDFTLTGAQEIVEGEI